MLAWLLFPCTTFVSWHRNICSGVILNSWQNSTWSLILFKNHTTFLLSIHCPALLDSYFILSPLFLGTTSLFTLTFSWWSRFLHFRENWQLWDNFPSSCYVPIHACSVPSVLLLGQLSVLPSVTLHLCSAFYFFSLIQGWVPAILSLLNHSFSLSTESFLWDMQLFFYYLKQNPIPLIFASSHPMISLLTSQNILELLFIFSLSNSFPRHLYWTYTNLPPPFPRTALFKVTNYFHSVRCAGEVSVLSWLDPAALCWPSWSLLLPHLLYLDTALSWFFVLSHSIPHDFYGLRSVPCGGSNLGTLLFSIFSLHSLSWLAHPVSQMTPKFISSPDTAPELQTHIFNCLLVTLLGCLITTSWTALTNLLLPQPYPSQLMPFILLLRQKPQSWPELFSFSSLVHLMSE